MYNDGTDKHYYLCKSPFTRGKPLNKSYGECMIPNSNISFVSSGRPSTNHIFPSFYNHDINYGSRLSSIYEKD